MSTLPGIFCRPQKVPVHRVSRKSLSHGDREKPEESDFRLLDSTH